jgi:hypothetical protein
LALWLLSDATSERNEWNPGWLRVTGAEFIHQFVSGDFRVSFLGNVIPVKSKIEVVGLHCRASAREDSNADSSAGHV